MATYPNLPDGFEMKLKAVELAFSAESEGDVDVYLGAACPYSDGAKRLLRKLLAPEGGGGGGGAVVGAVNPFRGEDMDEVDRFDLLLEEVEVTIGQMRDLEASLGGSGDADRSDMVAVLKAKTALLEKWVGLKDRALNLREMAEFQAVVLKALDEVLSVDQRAEMVERLRGLKSIKR